MLDDIVLLNQSAKLTGDYKLIEFMPPLVKTLTPRGTDAVFFQHIHKFETVLAGYSQIGHAYMAVYKGQLICIFGCVPLWQGVAECWLITDETLPNHARPFHRVSKFLLDRFMAELNLVRLQITVHSENVLAIKWAKKLYFKEEGLLRNYGPDERDFYMFARIE